MSSSQEKYSIDEMMDRLKVRQAAESDDDGELVTREDGTQAIRVRKRKRRTNQPAKPAPEKSMRGVMIQIWAVIALVLLAGVTSGIAIIYANSPGFRDGLIGKISGITGAEIDLRQFRMNPTEAAAGGLYLSWPAGNVLEQVTLGSLRAKTHPISFLGRKFTGEEITANEGTAVLRPPTAGEAKRLIAPAGAGALDFRRYFARNFSVKIGGGPVPLLHAADMEVLFQPRTTTGRPQLVISRGTTKIPGVPDYKISRGIFEFRGDEINVAQLALFHPDNREGTLGFSGKINPSARTWPTNLSVKIDRFRLEHITGPGLGNFISGMIDSTESAKSNYLTFNNSDDPDAGFACTFANSPDAVITLENLPFLTSLGQLTDDPWFTAPIFGGNARGEIRRSKDNITLGDLQLAAKGRMVVKGNITGHAGGVLSGELRVGIADAVIGASPNAKLLEAMLLADRDDFRWMTVRISGTTTAPSDDFRKQLDEQKARLQIQSVEPQTSDNERDSRPQRRTDRVPTFDELTPVR